MIAIGDLEYDREDRGAPGAPIPVVLDRRVYALPRRVPTRRELVLSARDALVLELARRTGLPLRDVREALREGRGAEELAAWSTGEIRRPATHELERGSR